MEIPAMKRTMGFLLIILTMLFVCPSVHGEDAGRAYYDLGVFAYEDGDYEGAERNFKKALNLDSGNASYHHYLGKTYIKSNRLREGEDHLRRAWTLNPQTPGLRYDIGLLDYRLERYRESAEALSQVATEEPSNVLAQYYAGISLHKAERHAEAIRYLLAASEMSPTIKANGYYHTGISYLKLGDFDKAAEKMQYAKEHGETESLRQYASQWLEEINKRKVAAKPYSLYVKLGYQYDSNVRLEPLDLDLHAKKSDYATVAYMYGRYDLLQRQDWTLGVGYSHYQTWYKELTQYNLVGSVPNFYTRYKVGNVILGMSYLPTYYWLESDSYLMRHQLMPEVMWQINDRLLGRVSYSYYRDNYMLDNGRDGHTNDGFMDVYYAIFDKKSYLFGGIGFEDRNATHPDRYYSGVKMRAGIFADLGWGFSLDLVGRYYEENYDNVDSFYGAKREDSRYVGSVALSKRLFRDWLAIVAEFEYTKNDSNIRDYEYDRKVTTLSLTARF